MFGLGWIWIVTLSMLCNCKCAYHKLRLLLLSEWLGNTAAWMNDCNENSIIKITIVGHCFWVHTSLSMWCNCRTFSASHAHWLHCKTALGHDLLSSCLHKLAEISWPRSLWRCCQITVEECQTFSLLFQVFLLTKSENLYWSWTLSV